MDVNRDGVIDRRDCLRLVVIMIANGIERLVGRILQLGNLGDGVGTVNAAGAVS